MKIKLVRNLIIAGMALMSALADAEIYPVEFSITPTVTSIATNSTFFVNVRARTTDGLSHNISLAEILVKWNPTYIQPLHNGSMDPWYVPQNGFTMIFPPLAIGADGSQLGLIGGSDALHPVNMNVDPTGLSLVTLRFRSLFVNGSSDLELPITYGMNDFLIQYSDVNGVQTVFGQDLAGLHGGQVNVGSVPEPTSIAALSLGLIALLRRSRTRR